MPIDLNKDAIAAGRERPQFFEQAGVDQLMHMFVAMAEEIAVLSERLDNAEALLEEKGLLEAQALDNYQPEPARARQRLERHQAMVARLLAVLEEAPSAG